jgi:hypothetical protein
MRAAKRSSEGGLKKLYSVELPAQRRTASLPLLPLATPMLHCSMQAYHGLTYLKFTAILAVASDSS